MNRKNFLINSGLSLAGLMIGTSSFGKQGNETNLLALPDEVWIDTGAALIRLNTLNDSKFIH